MKISIATAVTIALTSISYATPPNDDFADAIVIGGLPACTVQANTMEATLEEGEPPLIGPGAGQGSIWFRWIAEADGLVRFNLEGSSGFISGSSSFEIDAFTGESVGVLTEVGTTGRFFNRVNEVAVVAAAGTTYHIRVSGRGFSIYPVTVQVRSAALPPNDDFADATEIPASQTFPIKLSLDSSLATLEAGEDSDGGNVERSLWYSWEVPADGRYKIDTYGSFFGPLLEIFTGESLDALTVVGSEEDDDSDTLFEGAELEIDATAGTTYKIRVASQIFFGAVSDAGSGFLNLSRVTENAVNDAFADRIDIGNGRSRYTTGAGAASTREEGEPTTVSFEGLGSVWYEFTPEENGIYKFPIYDYIVYQGSTLEALTPTQEFFGFGTSVALEGGTTYHIAVYSSGSTEDFTVFGPAAPAAPADTEKLDLGTTDDTGVFVALRWNFVQYDFDDIPGEAWTWTPASSGTATLTSRSVLSEFSYGVFVGQEITDQPFLRFGFSTEKIESRVAGNSGYDVMLKFPVTAGLPYVIVGAAAPDDQSVGAGLFGFDLTVDPGEGTPLPAIAPEDVTLTVTGETVTLTWTPAPGTADGTVYQVQRSGDLSGFANAGDPTTGTSATVPVGQEGIKFFRIAASLPDEI